MAAIEAAPARTTTELPTAPYRKRRFDTGFWFKFALAILLLVPTLFPLMWIIVSSLKSAAETHTVPPVVFPEIWTIEPYQTIFERRNFMKFVGNSFVVGFFTTLWGVGIAAWSGYGFARYDFRFKTAALAFVLVAQSFPRILLILPYFQFVNRADLTDTYLALILAYSTFIQPLCLWVMKEYFSQIPRELDEAALVDGAGPYRAFWDIILPLARPALGATAIISFLTAWNEYEFALVLTTTDKVRTISVAIAYFLGEFSTQWNLIMAAAAVATVPLIVIFVFLQRQLMYGLTGGAVKG